MALNNFASVFIILCITCGLVGATSTSTHHHTPCVNLDGQDVRIAFTSSNPVITHSDLRRELSTQNFIPTNSTNWYFMESGTKVEQALEASLMHLSQECAIMKNSASINIKLCKLKEGQCEKCHDLTVDVSSGLKVQSFRQNIQSNLQQDLPCVDWRFIRNTGLEKIDNCVYKPPSIEHLLKPEDEQVTLLRDIILDGDVVLVINFFQVNQIEFSVNLGFAIHNFRMNPYITLGQFRKIASGTKTCDGMIKNEILLEKVREKWRVINRRLVWNTTSVLDPKYKLDPDVVIDIGNEYMYAINNLLYTAQDGKRFIDYQNTLSTDASFVGIKTKWITNPKGTISMRILKRNSTDPRLDPINISSIKAITERQVNYLDNVVVAENNTAIAIEIIFKYKIFSMSLRHNNGGGSVDGNFDTIVYAGPKVTVNTFYSGAHIILRTINPIAMDNEIIHNKINYALSLRAYKAKNGDEHRILRREAEPSVRVAVTDTQPGGIASDPNNHDNVRYNNLHLDDYNLEDEETLLFYVLIFKDRQTGERILNLIPQDPFSGDE